MSSMEERREISRLQMELPAHWESSQGTRSAVILNGSARGCFLKTQMEEPDDDALNIVIGLPHGEWISLWGEVAYYLPTEGFGLQFTSPPDCADAMLEKWLEYLCSLRENLNNPRVGRATTAPPAVSAL
jgi:hypothetical protein